jgi:Uma2 family endonuclease
MSAAPVTQYTLAEYLAREETAVYKSEFYRGQIFAMSGGTPRHNTASANILTALRGRLRGTPCRPFNSDQQIRIPANGLMTYPDVSVVRGELQLAPQAPNAIINPRVIFEVLSKSTDSYDRGKKFDLYRQLEFLREYVLIAQDEPHVERFVRQVDDSWLLTVFKGLDAVVELTTLNCALPLAEIYEDVTFGADEASSDLAVTG